MDFNKGSDNVDNSISRVFNSRDKTRKSYDRISKFYDFLAGGFEARHRDRALDLLSVKAGERVLDVGFGTGHSIVRMAELTGTSGKVYGLDLSSGMLAVAKRRLNRAGFLENVDLACGNALEMPYQNEMFDAVLISFTLELFDTPEIPLVLDEIRRVLKSGGRLGVVGLSRAGGQSFSIKLYEWAHKYFPGFFDCRPIYVAQALKDASFSIVHLETINLFGISLEIVTGLK